MPLLPLRGLVLFPETTVNFDVGRAASIAALDEAMAKDQLLFVVAQKDMREDAPQKDDLYETGTIVRVKQVMRLQGEFARVLVEGLQRAKIVQVAQSDTYLEAEVEPVDIVGVDTDEVETQAMMRGLTSLFEEYVRISGKISPDTLLSVVATDKPGSLADIVAINVLTKLEDKQAVLDIAEPLNRMEHMQVVLTREAEIQKMDQEISNRVKKQISTNQKEYYLHEQIKAIQKELGEDTANEVEQIRKAIKKAKMPQEAHEKALKELDRFAKMPAGSPETAGLRNWLDWVVELPWSKATTDNHSIRYAEDVLNNDHHGLDKVKERILEYLAVHQLTQNMRGPILCFVGPPGVGKTSIAKSVANALGRKFVRMSLGGMRDEAEIRGHRRTYIGSIPGRVMANMKLADSNNPVFLFDEVDKLRHDMQGDPAAALLEVLDAEQNYAFRDHYLEVPFDLSKVMFLATANSVDTIPAPLLDRMEVIQLSGYTPDEKIEIARHHLIPRQLQEHGLKPSALRLTDDTLEAIITRYTRESGVRNLERELGRLCRKTARIVLQNKRSSIRVHAGNLAQYLGIPRMGKSAVNEEDAIGQVTGLAWTNAGGETLLIEVGIMPGSGKLELTGQLGDVMKESATAGLSYIRAHAKAFGLAEDFYRHLDIHIHIPEGAIKKDGPSAGITMATAMISGLSGVPASHKIAMTGEITLRGRVLPIGGLKEKALAAHRAGIETILIPKDNEKDLEDIPASVRKKLHIVAVSTLDEVLERTLCSKEEK